MLDQSREIFVLILAIAIGVGDEVQAQCQANELAKLTASDVGVSDLLVLLANWGPCR